MEKTICRLSYWLGLVSLVIALIWRALNAFGLWKPMAVTPGYTVYYMSFYKASLIFFVTTIATWAYASVASRQ